MNDENYHLPPYNITHRAFLQSLLSTQTLTYTQSKPLLAAIQTAHTPDRPTLPNDITHEDFESYIQAVSTAVSPFDYEIRSLLDQRTKERVYALVNVASDPITQLATWHTADEIAFVKRVLDAIFETFNTPRAEVLAITEMQAVRLVKAPREEVQTQGSAAAATALTISQGERVLASLVEEGWFTKSENGFYTLSPRGLMELRTWLVDMYNDDEEDEDGEVVPRIKMCVACREIVTMGQRCPNVDCLARVHDFCVRNMFRRQGGEEKCITCKTDWRDPLPVGEKAAPRDGRQGVSSRRSTNGDGARRTTGSTTGRKSNGMTTGFDHDEESDASGGAE